VNSFILLREMNLGSVSCQTGPACADKPEAKATEVSAGFSVQSSLPAKNAFFSPQSKLDFFRWLVIQHQLVTVNSVTPPNQAESSLIKVFLVQKMPDPSTSPLQFWLKSPPIKSGGFPENLQPSAQRLWRNSSCCFNLNLHFAHSVSTSNCHVTFPPIGNRLQPVT
jgi:hypothetical protein